MFYSGLKKDSGRDTTADQPKKKSASQFGCKIDFITASWNMKTSPENR